MGRPCGRGGGERQLLGRMAGPLIPHDYSGTAQRMIGMPADLARLPGWAQWPLLLALAALLTLGFRAGGMPASQLLGPMAASILFSLGGGTVRLPRQLYVAAQAMVGCMIATVVTPGILHTFVQDWALILVAVLSTLGASSL